LNVKLAILGNVNLESICVHGYFPRLLCATKKLFVTPCSLPDHGPLGRVHES
jgi:hypothetical protein